MGVNQLRTPNIAMIAAACGFDAVYIDLEHNPTSLETAAGVCVAALGMGITPIARVTSNDPHDATRILDCGAQGVMVPHVQNAAEAKAIVEACLYAPKDRVTHGLKRVQVEPLGHEINPPAYRAIAAALNAEYGQPTQRCITPPVPDAGFQAAVEERWQHDDAAISAIFRDTTLQAFEGCLYGPASGWCGLHGQILVRISPAAPQSVACAPPAWPG